MAAFAVAAAVERKQHAAGEMTGFLDDAAHQARVDLGECRKRGKLLRRSEEFGPDKLHIPERRRICDHPSCLRLVLTDCSEYSEIVLESICGTSQIAHENHVS